MTERLLRLTLEGTFGLPHEVAKRTIDIIKNKNGEYFSKYTRMNVNQKRETIKKKLLTNDVDEIMVLLLTVQIPAFPKHQMGCDGGFTELEVGGYSGKSHFRWWSVPPDGWDVLNKISSRIISCADIGNA